MEQAELAVRLFLTQDPQEADRLAETLCRLNRERQTIESEIYSEAVSRLHGAPDGAIVLAGEHWHQGVVGIVASRLSEEFCRPTFLICLDGDKGKASGKKVETPAPAANEPLPDAKEFLERDNQLRMSLQFVKSLPKIRTIH